MVLEDRMTAQSGDIREDAVKALDRISQAGVRIANGGDVENFLLDRPAIQLVLPDVVDEAVRRLGEGGQLVLELDCSAGLGNEYLVLLLQSRTYDAMILELRRDLTAKARAQMEVPERRFIVTTDFAQPL
jgi:hypothetical protein